MKNNFTILFINEFRMMWNRLKYSKRKTRFLPLPVLVVVIGGVILFSMVSSAYGQMILYLEEGHPESIVYSYASMVMMIALMLSVTRSGTSNSATDADFLLSLPIKKSTILFSKSVTRYVFDLGMIALIFAPSVVIYYMMTAQPLFMLLRGIFVILLFPLFSVGVAYLISYLLLKLSRSFKRPEMLRTGLMVIFTAAFFIVYISMTGSMGMGGNFSAIVNSSSGPQAWVGDFIVEGSLGALGLILATTVVPFGLGVILQASIFGRKAGIKKSTDSALKFRSRGQLKALLHKEVRFYLSIPIYVTNTIVGPVMAIGGTVAVVAARGDIINFIDEFFPGTGILIFFVFLAACFIASMMFITASSISLEGKNIRVLRAAPLGEHMVFISKILLQIIIAAPIFAVCIAVVGVSLAMPFGDIVLFELAIAMLSVLVAVWGLYVNLIFPKMEWDSEVAVVKQSMATMVAVFTGMATIIVPIIIYFVFFGSFFAVAVGSFAVFTALTAIVCALLFTDGIKRYREL